jgi:sugar phosphate isomerase/epimerase
MRESKMKIGFNGASTMKADLPEDIRVASLGGYDLIEIWAKKMEAFLSDHSLDDLRKLLEKARVKPLAINSVEFITFNSSWEKTNAEFDRDMQRWQIDWSVHISWSSPV